MKSSVQELLQEMDDYKLYSKRIDIEFLCILLKNIYIQKEKMYQIDAVNEAINYISDRYEISNEDKSEAKRIWK